jgi:hypothetical protein
MEDAREEPSADTRDLSAETAGFWDELEFVDRFGAKPFERAGPDEICCRECGSAVAASQAALGGHLGSAHDMDLDRYRRLHPGAPLEGGETSRVEWVDPAAEG